MKVIEETLPLKEELIKVIKDNDFIMSSLISLRDNNDGGPFGAFIFKRIDNQLVLIAEGRNRVLATNDPTAHAEVVAIRNACSELKTHDLSDCIMVATNEPCPMCLASIKWANIKDENMFFLAKSEVASNIGFRDDDLELFLHRRYSCKHVIKEGSPWDYQYLQDKKLLMIIKHNFNNYDKNKLY